MDATNKSRIGIIILAAGESARLGRPKQLLDFKGETLICRAAQTALAAESEKVIVVLGANYQLVEKELNDLPLEIVRNEDWKSGMSSSLKIGLKKLLEIEPDLSVVVLTLCDQPLIDASVLNRLIEVYKQSKAKIVASEYAGTVGVPALFDESLFSEMLNLSADGGAKQIIRKYSAMIEKIRVPEAEADIDTPTDYEKLIINSRK